MLHILVSQITPRVEYTLNWIFQNRLKVAYTLYTHTSEWQSNVGAKINYTDLFINDKDILHIKPNHILYQYDVQPQAIRYNRWKHTSIIFYNQPGKKIPFDIFGAIFFLLSRYEEYLPHKKDNHKRFSSQNSIAHQFNFLQEPVIDKWLIQFSKILKADYNINTYKPSFSYIPTYDIDVAYNFKLHSTFHQLIASVKDIATFKWKRLALRWNVINQQAKDPYDNFTWLDNLHQELNLKPIYFWLVSNNVSKLDQNNKRNDISMQALYAKHKAQYINGIHPSYISNTNQKEFDDELSFCKAYLGNITASRQHYIKLQLPNTYRQLILNNIYNDYSMGYPDANGFRAGTSNSFLWFDLLLNQTTNLEIHPFCFMEATSIFYNKHNADEAYKELERIYWEIRNSGGTMITIFHNYTLGDLPAYKGWRNTYYKFLQLATEKTRAKQVL
jgi:hypothetical protein